MSNFTSKFKSTPTFTFRGWNESVTSYNDQSVTPSPLHYNPQKMVSNKSPSAKFPKASRREWAQVQCRKQFPGPGSHETISYTTDGLKKTISTTKFVKELSKTPGPNQYSPNSQLLLKQEPSFTMQRRTLSSLE